MKPATVLCSAILILLTACGRRVSADPAPAATPHSAPIALSSGSTASVPCSLTPDQLPREPVESLVAVWNGEPACLLPQEDITLYGLYSEDKSQSLVLRYGEELTAYELPWLGPRCIPPQLFIGDYDGDGDRETLVLTYTGSGTGVSSWTLTLLERTEEGWEAVTLPDASYQEDLSSLLACRWLEGTAVLSLGEISLPLPALSEYVGVGEALEPVAGTILRYEAEGDGITAILDVGVFCEAYATPYYCARLEGRLVYDGEGFSLLEPQLSPLED